MHLVQFPAMPVAPAMQKHSPIRDDPAGESVNGGQSVHVDSEVALIAPEYLPLAHEMQTVVAASFEYLPDEHMEQFPSPAQSL